MTAAVVPPSPAVVFDMDGTLLRLDVDIEEVRTRLAALFAPHGVTAPFRPILRRLREAAVEAEAAGGDSVKLLAQGLAILDEWEVKAARSARARQGGPALTADLHAAGVKLAVVTDNGRACVGPALSSSGYDPSIFTILVTRDDVDLPKPHPDGVVKAVRALGAAAPTWYVGDHKKDVEAGIGAVQMLGSASTVHVAALAGGLGSDAELAGAGAEKVLTSLDEVRGLDGIQAHLGRRR
jgi:N-acetyl-D-muramate 6-phosphate phosphatase